MVKLYFRPIAQKIIEKGENEGDRNAQFIWGHLQTEMVKYSNNNILSQAGQAMLAQANQSNQGVLSLLQ